MIGKDRKGYGDAYWSSFHGFDKLEREFRADGYYQGKASHFAKCKEELIRSRPRSHLDTHVSECFMAGPLRAFAFLKDTAAIIHGPTGCGHNIFLVSGWFQMENIICTQTDENDVLMGNEEKLIKAIKEAVDRFQPGMIGVITTCSTSIIGSDTSGICSTMERRTGVPIIPFPAAGFRYRNWNLGAEEAFNIIIDRMERPKKVHKGSINFFNFPNLAINWKEVFDLLPYFDELGIKINIHVPCQITFQQLIERFPKAELNVVRCPGTGYQSAEYAEKVLGIPYLPAPKPLSLKFIERFIRGLGDFFGCPEKAEALIHREEQRIKDRLDRVKERLKRKRVALSTCSGKSIALAQMAFELGMEVVFLGTYKTDSRYHDDLKDWLESSGLDPDMGAESAIYEEEAMLSKLRPDFFMGSVEGRCIADRLGIPNLDMIGNPNPQTVGFEGFIRYAELIANIMENKFYKNWASRLWRIHFPYSSKEYIEETNQPVGQASRLSQVNLKNK